MEKVNFGKIFFGWFKEFIQIIKILSYFNLVLYIMYIKLYNTVYLYLKEGFMERKELNMSEVREKLADIIEEVKMKNESIIIEKYNKPQAAIVPYPEYEAFEEWEIEKESELMKKLMKKDSGIRYNWEDVKKELFENVPAKPFRRTKKVSKKSEK